MTEHVGQGSLSYQYGGGAYREAGCDHTQLTHVMTLGKAKIWAGSRNQAEAEYGWKLMVCCLGHPTVPPAPVRLSVEAKKFLPATLAEWAPPAVISIDWGDGSVPPMGKQWWVDFYNALREVDGDVVFYCFGGHGRTGTALSILAALGGLKKKGCPVRWVRHVYCNKAVETSVQIEYIEAVSGEKVLSQSSAMVTKLQNDKEDAARKALPVAPPTTTTTTAVTETFRYDKETNKMVKDGDAQDWESSHWNHHGMY